MMKSVKLVFCTAVAAAPAFLLMQGHALSAPVNEDWRTLAVPDLGTRVQYPAGIFSVPDGKPEKGVGERLSTEDGRATLTVYSHANESGETPATYLHHHLRTPRAQLHYQRVTPAFFAISMLKEDTIYTAAAISRAPGRLSFTASISSIRPARSAPGTISSRGSACHCARCRG
jgi:hypothetical protein